MCNFNANVATKAILLILMNLLYLSSKVNQFRWFDFVLGEGGGGIVCNNHFDAIVLCEKFFSFNF